MITIFSAPKPFVDPHIALIQRNAIDSWVHLHPDAQVILFGADEGVGKAANEFGVRHVPEVATSEEGTPLISDIFAQAERLARHSILCFVNGDIILGSDVLDTVKLVRTKYERFFISGQRYNVDITERISFADTNVRQSVEGRGEWFGPIGMDYFIYPTDMLGNLPDFVIGRAGWDNYMVFHVLKRKIPFIDATESIFAIHQNHDYSHLKSGQAEAYYKGVEAKKNKEINRGLMGSYTFLLTDASHRINGGGVVKKTSKISLTDRLLKLKAFYPRFGKLFGGLWYVLRSLKRLID